MLRHLQDGAARAAGAPPARDALAAYMYYNILLLYTFIIIIIIMIVDMHICITTHYYI